MIQTTLGTISLSLFDGALNLSMRHNLAKRNKMTQPTVKMLSELAAMAAKEFRRAVTVAQAWQIWKACLAFEMHALETQRQRSEVAFWYGIDPFAINDKQVAKLHCNLYRVKAQNRIHEGNYDPYDYANVYSLFLVAYDDEHRALKARAQSIEALMDRRG